MRYIFPAAIVLGLLVGFCCPPSIPAEVYSTPNGDISVAEGDCYGDDACACPDPDAGDPGPAEDAAPDAGGLAVVGSITRPANYDALLAYAQEHYHDDVDCAACIDRFCVQVAKLPELPFAETVTAFTCVARFESGGDPDVVSSTSDRGSLQINACHRRPMRESGLDYDGNEDHRVYWASVMVAGQLAKGDSWWGAFSPWAVLRKHGRTIKADYQTLLEGVE